MQWGAEIPVNGVRPAWLSDEEAMLAGWKRSISDQETRIWSVPDAWTAGSICRDTYAERGWINVEALRLPVNHWAYRVIEAGFEPWRGGDAAPADWDGGDVLLRDDRLIKWSHHNIGWIHWSTGGDIIGYRKKAAAIDPPSPADPLPPGFYVAATKRGGNHGRQPHLVEVKSHNDIYAFIAAAERLPYHSGGTIYVIAEYDWSPVSADMVRDIEGQSPNVGRGTLSFAKFSEQPAADPLTITITGPQASGKTRWAELIRNLPAALLGYPVPVVVDGEEG